MFEEQVQLFEVPAGCNSKRNDTCLPNLWKNDLYLGKDERRKISYSKA